MERLCRLLRLATALGAGMLAILAGAAAPLLGTCGPFVDTANDAFCPFIFEVFVLGITTGTTATTFDPTSAVNRTQMAAFLSRTVDRTLQRANHRAAQRRFWTQGNSLLIGKAAVGGPAYLCECDGTDVWAGDNGSFVYRFRGSDGRLLEAYSGANKPTGVLAVGGRIYVTGYTQPAGALYMINPTLGGGAVTTLATNLGAEPFGIAYDGSRIWTANDLGSMSIVTPAAVLPWTVTTVTAGFSFPQSVVFDGAGVWVPDDSGTPGKLLKVDANAAILQTVTIGTAPGVAVFDGNNIWVPNRSSESVSVVKTSTGAVLATLTGNGLATPQAAAFDGQRILVTNYNGQSVSLWKAADFTALGSF